jgi:hypothetical protein
MAKIFYGLKDSYQATYILENVIQNFTDFQMWLPMLKELDRIKWKNPKRIHPLLSRTFGITLKQIE